MPDEYEVIGAGARDEVNPPKPSDHDITMDFYVTNIDKNELIHGGPYTRQLMNVTV